MNSLVSTCFHTITKLIKQKWTLMGASQKNIQSGHDLTKKHIGETSQMSKAAHTTTNTGLWKVCKTFSQTFLWKRYDTPSSLTKIRQKHDLLQYRHSSNMAEHDSSHISSLTIPLAKPQKVNIPPTNHPFFSKQISNIYIFPDLTILFVLTVHFYRRFDRPETRLNLQTPWWQWRPVIQTILMTQMISSEHT